MPGLEGSCGGSGFGIRSMTIEEMNSEGQATAQVLSEYIRRQMQADELSPRRVERDGPIEVPKGE